MSKRRIAVVIVNYRTPDLAVGALAALEQERAAESGLRVILVDGGSNDGSAAILQKGIDDRRFGSWASLLPLGINGGFGWANNQAILRLLQSDHAPDYILLLNPDTVIEPGAVSRLADALDAHPRCAAAGSQLIEPDGSPSGSAFVWPDLRSEIDRGAKLGILKRLLGFRPFAVEAPAGEVDWVTGASVMLRSDALRDVGLFDTGFFLYFEEVELMWRLHCAGWSIRHEPASRVAHVGGAATGVNGSRPEAERPARPAYWYKSRRRFMALAHGKKGPLVASLGWLAGHATLVARRAIGGGKHHPMVAQEARDLLAHGIRGPEITPAFPKWDEMPGNPPAWMKG